MSKPTFVPERSEIWYSDGNSGFYAVRVTNGVWPFRTAGAGAKSVAPAAVKGTRGAPQAAGSGLAATGTAMPRAAVAMVVAFALVLRALRRRVDA